MYNSYWNKSNRERSEMAREEVLAFVDLELMEKGILKVNPPILEPVAEVDPPKTLMFCIEHDGEYSSRAKQTDALFSSADDVLKAIAMHPVTSKYDYTTKVTHVIPMIRPTVGSVEVLSQQTMQEFQKALTTNAAAIANNERAIADYNKASVEQQKAIDGLLKDWRDCCDMAYRYKRVASTRADYLKLCKGDAEIAETFLRKNFTEEEITEADEWFKD